MLLKYYCTVLFSFRNIIISIYIIYLLYISFARSCCYAKCKYLPLVVMYETATIVK